MVALSLAVATKAAVAFVLVGIFIAILPAEGWMAPGVTVTSRLWRTRTPAVARARSRDVLKAAPSRCSVALKMSSETYEFESNVSRVMDIIIHSLYSNKDVFVRELVSNAADACDKKRFLSLTTTSQPASGLKIRVHANREAGTLTIEDNGIGMNKEDMIQNLGRIAESGTKKFVETMSKNKDDMSLIGQFGVGFYSGFLVAQRVVVTSKGSDRVQHRWEASADNLSKYTISDDSSNPDQISDTGTMITLHLKDEYDQYLDDVALQALLEKYSEFIPFPIELEKYVTKPVEEVDTSKPIDGNGTVPMKTVMRRTPEWRQVNTKRPLWLRSPKDCQPEDYTLFYQQTFKAYDKPLATSHFSVEGNVDFKALLFLPTEVPYDLSRDMFASTARSMRLYVKRVFINDKFEDLLPRWLLFLRGVVDSEDLPLNVGREVLQQSRSLRLIKQRLVKKSLEMISDVARRNETEYQTFWKHFGKYLKVGVIEDESHRDDLLPLCRFFSSHNLSALTSLPAYLQRMPPDQKSIYYVVGETRAQASMSPALESLRKRGMEVLIVSEPIDEMTLQNIGQLEGKTVVDVGKEHGDESDADKSVRQKQNEDLEGFRAWLKEILGNRVTRVEVSTRLVESPAVLVQSEYGVSPNMQKYLRAQAVVEGDDKGALTQVFNQAVLEINPSHPVIIALKEGAYEKDPQGDEARERVQVLFGTAALAAGYALENSADYARMVVGLMSKTV